jgi:hypothetical protein
MMHGCKRLYSTARWRLRARQLEAEPLCRVCKDEGRLTPATTCDHVDPHRGDVGKFWAGSVQSLCDGHHSRDKRILERGGIPRPHIAADGWPVE